MATYYRVGGRSTRYDTLAAANRRASSIFARTGIVASVTEHRTRERGTPPPAAPAPVNDYPKNLAQLKTYLAAGRTVYCSYSLAAKLATGAVNAKPSRCFKAKVLQTGQLTAASSSNRLANLPREAGSSPLA